MTAPLSNTATANAKPAPMHVLVIGGGIGGLALAQGLKKAGVSVAVYERDRSPADRLQGYRVHISPVGSRALHECLPPHLFEAVDRTCGKPARAVHFLTERMKTLMTFGTELVAMQMGDPIARHRSVSRITLRQVLLSGLDDAVHFGKMCTGYEERADGRFAACFADGTSAVGDILVAADGGSSRVRQQLLPHAQRIDTGVIGVAGKIILNDDMRKRIAPMLLDGLALIAAPGGLGLFVATQDLGSVVGSDGIGVNDPHADAFFENTQSYLMWALSAKRETLGLGADAETLDSATLSAAASRAMAGWAKEIRDLVDLADPASISCFAMRTSVPIAPWPTGRVTLIGDAIHAMTPYRGVGANIALKDAVRLCGALVTAERGERDLIEAIHDYEAGMIGYGFAAVRNSLDAMHQTIGYGRVGMTMSRMAMRTINALPPLKRMVARRMGGD